MGHVFVRDQMDKTWITRKRTTPEFQQGVEVFIQFSLKHEKKRGENMLSL